MRLPGVINSIVTSRKVGDCYFLDFFLEAFNQSTTDFFLTIFFSNKLEFAALRLSVVGLSTRVEFLSDGKLSSVGESKRISLKVSTSIVQRLLLNANFLMPRDWFWSLALAYFRTLF